MSLIGLLLAIAIGMAVYYGVNANVSTASLMAHTPGHGIGLVILLVLIIAAVLQVRKPRTPPPDDDE